MWDNPKNLPNIYLTRWDKLWPSDEYACIEEAGENGYEDDWDIEDTDVDGWFVSNVVESSTYEDLRVKSLQTEKKLLDVQTTLRIMKKKISLLTNMKDVHKLLREGEEWVVENHRR